jgi:glutamine synthetase
MASTRFSALEGVTTPKSPYQKVERINHRRISDFFGKNVFNLRAMKEYLTESAYQSMFNGIRHGSKIDHDTAENVAKGLIKWATDNEATHYTHWFQPLTGSTAEKHDAFYKPSLDVTVQGMEHLTASELVQREPDASSFPSGGLRSTFEARGYTIWDPSSPAFILETESSKTLYVPAIFISYTGESLDYKTPLLKSNELLNKAATAVCHYFDPTVNNVITTLGWEQEYFIIDEKFYNARPDLALAGRTLFGGHSVKGQQMEDHYFASIPERIQEFMFDFEQTALQLGIPVLTRHNEVAPAQYECAPMFEELNVAVDHNLLVMDLMNRIAHKHSLRVLFHEKPFEGINGSGKHNNWSMASDKGKNLLNPGDMPESNLQFLTFFICTVRAVEQYEELLRSSIATPGNDHRLGANEAPPAIISVFTGKMIEEILKKFKTKGLSKNAKLQNTVLDLNIPKIPEAQLDNTDRNRTSPFPFTGNKFEFRAVGSSANCAPSLTVLNTAVSDVLISFKEEVDTLVSNRTFTQEEAIISVLKRYLLESERIIFNGNGYSEEWEVEAKKRGLSNLKTTPEALPAMISEKAIELFGKHDIFNERELHARYEIQLEYYIKKRDIEARLMVEIAQTHILPSATDYLQKLTDNWRGLNEMGLSRQADRIKERVTEIFNLIEGLETELHNITKHLHTAHDTTDLQHVAELIAADVLPAMEKARECADQLETHVDDSAWKLPKYRELLFVR